MPVIAASEETAATLAALLSRLPAEGDEIDPDALRATLADSSSLERAGLHALACACREALDETGFVHVQGLHGIDGAVAVLLGLTLGTPQRVSIVGQGQVATLTPRLDSSRQAHTSDALELHTDFSTMPRPPAVTILHVVRAHPLGPGYARTGVCLARDIVSAGAALRGCLTEIPFPFADPGADRAALVSPLVEVEEPRCRATVRYHADRLRDGFSALGRLPTEHELQVLADFRALAAMNRREFALASGDLLLINNRTVLHDRSASPLVIHPTRRDGRLVKTVFLTDLTPTVGMPA